jgi:hypothetical protein
VAVDLEKLLATVEAASRLGRIATDLISDASEGFSEADQSALRAVIRKLRAENQKGFLSLDGKLAALIAQGGEGG